MYKKWTLQEDEILSRNYSKLSHKKIKNKFPNRSLSSITHRANRLKLTRTTGRERAKINDAFFAIPNPNSAYWAGILAADGCIHSDRLVSLELQYQDRMEIFKLKHAISYDGNIFEKKNKDKSFSRLSFVSKKIVKDLNKIYNLSQRKSLTLRPPNIKNQDIVRSFIRGYFDGDGSIFLSNGKYRISFSGTKLFLNWIQSTLNKYISNLTQKTIVSNNGIYSLTYSGTQVSLVLDWIYKYSNVWTRLDRKYLKYNELSLR